MSQVPDPAPESLIQIVTMTLGDQLYGIEILAVQEINRMTDITRVPNAPDFVEGVINLRGHVIPVVDLRRRLRLASRERDEKTRIVVVDLEGQKAGLIVDAVQDVLRIPKSTIDPPPSVATGVGGEYVKGVARLEAGRLLVLLELEKVLSRQEREDLHKIEETFD